jgi:uncharacterized protein (DUF427 family)
LEVVMKSPGHKQWPQHKVNEKHLSERVQVEVDGEVVADSIDVVKVEEDASPPRYYFPRHDVHMEKLSRSSTTSECPFKGTAHYFDVHVGGKVLRDAVWTYEEPFDEHRHLKDRVAFYEGKLPEVSIHVH